MNLISDLDPRSENLEGYLFPDTYEFSPETTPAEVVEMMQAVLAAYGNPIGPIERVTSTFPPDRDYRIDHRD